MSGRYNFVARLRKHIKLSNSTRNPFRYLFGPKTNPNKIHSHNQHFDKQFIDEMERKKSSLLSHQWAHSSSLQNKWTRLKNIWFDARTSGVSLFQNLNDVDSQYLSKHLLNDMNDDDAIKSKWIKFTKKKLLRLGNASMNNKIEIYHRGELFFKQLWNDIKRAQQQILMETYIMEPDKIAIKTIKLLTDASLRGVSVTLIIDSFGSSKMKVDNNEYLNELRRAGAVVLEYNKVKVSKSPFIFAYRNHKKIIVIDDTYGYTGGMNVSAEYCGFDIDGGINKFRDTHARLQGHIVRYLKESLYFTVLDINPTPPPYDGDDTESSDDEDDTDTSLSNDIRIQKLFPYQILPGFLKNFNSLKNEAIDKNELSETYRNRLKILASSPRKSLSEQMQQQQHYNYNNKTILEVSALSKLMEEAKQTNNFPYSLSKKRVSRSENNLYIQVLESYRDKRFRLIQKALMNAIDNSLSHVFIMNPYFLPPVKLKKRLLCASQRGVDVRVITCDQSDVPFISMASRHIYEELLSKNNIRLFEYEGNNTDECANILHAKICLIDDVFVSLGSFNWDDWSYTKNLEMNLMIVDDKVAKSVHEQFIIDQQRSKEIKIDNVKNDRYFFQKCLYYCAYIVSRVANRML